jgi:hypothetical protein
MGEKMLGLLGIALGWGIRDPYALLYAPYEVKKHKKASRSHRRKRRDEKRRRKKNR